MDRVRLFSKGAVLAVEADFGVFSGSTNTADSVLSVRRAASFARDALLAEDSSCTPGNKSFRSDKNSGVSSATIFERFISRSVVINSISSSASKLSRFVFPAVRRTDKILRNPKS